MGPMLMGTRTGVRTALILNGFLVEYGEMIEGLLSHFDDNTNHKYNPKNNNLSYRKV